MKERNKDLLDTLNIVQGMFSAGEVEALGADPDAVKARLGDSIYRGAVESFGAQPVDGAGRIERSQGPSAVLVEGAGGCALEERVASMAEDVKVYPEPEADPTEYPCTDTHYAPGGKSDAESALFFEDPAEAMEAYQAAKDFGLTSGEVCFDPTIDPKFDVGSYAVRFSPITMMGKSDIVRRVVEMRAGWKSRFIEDVQPVQEHNPFHDRSGEFASKGDLAQGGGSWSLRIGSRRGGGAVEKSKVTGGKKVGKGKSKRTELKKKKWKTGWTGEVCGRAARRAGKDVKCSESLGDRIEELRSLLDDA
jgi:hypothetical protein